jgi:hypothetical protein
MVRSHNCKHSDRWRRHDPGGINIAPLQMNSGSNGMNLPNLPHRAQLTSRRLAPGLLTLAALALTVGPTGAQTLLWSSSYNGIPTSALEEVEGVVVDAAGNVFAAGLSGNGSGSAICTMRLNSSGAIQWTLTESKASLCGGMWGRTPLALDADGNLIVVGAEFTPDMNSWNPLMLKCSADGASLAREVFDFGPFASFDAVALDSSTANTYVIAHNNPNNGYPHVVRTLKLDAHGDIVWQSSFAPDIFWGTRGAVAVTGSGVFTAAGGKLTKRDLQSGSILWEKDVSMSNGGAPLATDSAGNLYVAPLQNGVTKYAPDGTVLTVLSSISNLASDIDLDGAGNIYIASSTLSTSKSGSDILTQKYDPSGKLVWSATHGKNGPYSDSGLALTVRGGYVYVGGSKYNKNLDMCTLKYTAGK